MNSQQTWFITGASRGLGLELTRQLLRQGHRVAATSRDVAGLRRAVDADGAEFLPLAADLGSEASVAEAVNAAVERFGRIDVVVNNAGYGQLGALEELTDGDARANFDVNVFGTLNVIRQVMPRLRAQGGGHVINVSSIAGMVGGFPGWGVYCATKFAVEGLSEALAAEAAPFGVRVTVVEPGYFRTDFLSSGSLRLPAGKLNDYTLVRDSEAYHEEQMRGNQPGDPAKAAAAIIRVASEPQPPLHLLLGRDAHDMAASKLQSLSDEIARWKDLTLSTGFAEAAA
ncbi:oxidoreductase [Longimicrobium sp.]|uniref:oxidoreductase n=1 Tax=Longimicrobium sp. TaxID=2029185 RepID=UPI002E30A290|nr:oxidoreductase [Longimicrobium sp.]HEX6040689.1 oxidoreductase [Longimicrobium sp.]